MTDYAISTDLLTRRFGSLTAVDHVALRVPAGCVYGFLGPNGAGKSTTIRMLLGLITGDSGRIELLGEPLTKSRHQLAQVGSLVESASLYPHLSGSENLEVICRLTGTSKRRIAPTLDLVGLEPTDHRPTKAYSLGMRQRLGLALALLREPRLLILDEPTNGLDPAGIHEIRALLRRLPQETGVTVFLSSHLLAEVEQIATHLGIIHQGRLIFQGTLDSLTSQTSEYVVVTVDQPQTALRLLESAGRPVTHRPDGSLRIAATTPTTSSELNALLVGAGLDVSSITRQRSTLEELFLQITQTKPTIQSLMAAKSPRHHPTDTTQEA